MYNEYAITKSPDLRGYALHRMVEGLTGGKSPLFADAGDKLIIRTDAELAAEKVDPRLWNTGHMMTFQLRACVGKKRKGRHIYLAPRDIAGRREWLTTKAAQHGFEVVSVHVIPDKLRIEKNAKPFTVDATEFVGILRVTDAAAFADALKNGIGRTARAFGLGMILI